MTPRMVAITCHCTLRKLGKKGQFVCDLVNKSRGGGDVSSFETGEGAFAWGSIGMGGPLALEGGGTLLSCTPE